MFSYNEDTECFRLDEEWKVLTEAVKVCEKNLRETVEEDTRERFGVFVLSPPVAKVDSTVCGSGG